MPSLLGRRRESDILDSLIDEVRSGRSGALVISGEAGVGKTALLDRSTRRASGCRVVRATGVESEMELAFAGLHQVCGPFLGGLPRLPEPQAAALEVAYGLRNGDAPDRFLVGLATLSLLSDAGAEQPVLCIVDDAQWLDRASVQVLAFVARRLAADAVGLVFAVRDAEAEAELRGLDQLVVGGLGDDDARTLFTSVVAGWVDAQVRDRMIAETRGNPLALVELTRGLTAAQLAGGIGPTSGRALPSRVEESFLRRVRTLPAPVRRLLLVAAAEPTGDPVLLWRAIARMGIAGDTADLAQTDGLLSIDDRVAFRHPLARSAAYRAAPHDERRAAHLALAEITNPDTDPDRRAWHLAAASEGPDEDVAQELLRCADRARARGGMAAAAAFQRRAVALTEDQTRRAERALRAAETSLSAGDFDSTRDLLAIADAGSLDELQRARVALVRADVAYSRSRGSEGPIGLLEAARVLDQLDPDLARQSYLDAWSAALFAGHLAGAGGDLAEVSRRALAAPRPSRPPRPCDVLLDGLSLAIVQGRRAAGPVLSRATSSFDTDLISTDELLRWGWLASAAAIMIWDYDRALAVAKRSAQVARRAGALTVLVVDLNLLAELACISGDLDSAKGLVDEAIAVSEATGSRLAPFGSLHFWAMQGRETDTISLVEDSISSATALGQGGIVRHATWSIAMLYNGLGRHREAFDAAEAACRDNPDLLVATWAAGELIEAAVEIGEIDVARRAFTHIVEATGAAGTPLARGFEARCRALLAGDDAEEYFRSAIEDLSLTWVRPELARARLHYGTWLHHRRRSADARHQLTAAHEGFVSSGMEAFADRARRQLSEIGVRLPGPRGARPVDALTTQEAEIARLAAAGRSNPEIGAQLFVSPRTVEWHLHKVFVKLGAASRADLARALTETAPSI